MNQAELTKILESHQLWLQGKGGQRANLRGSNLSGSNLSGSDLRETLLPPPTMLLLATWGEVSDSLTIELMWFDAANHPEPKKFDEWAKGGDCPYKDAGWQRCVNFQEKRDLWSPGSAKSALELVLMLFAEKDIKR